MILTCITWIRFHALLWTRMLGAWLSARGGPTRSQLSFVIAATVSIVAFVQSLPVDLMEGSYRDVFVVSEHLSSPVFVSALFSTLNTYFLPIALLVLLMTASGIVTSQAASLNFPLILMVPLIIRADAGCRTSAFEMYEQCRKSGLDYGAYKWLRKAAKNGHVRAVSLLEGEQ